MNLVIGGDHAGYELKERMVPVLKRWGHSVQDIGTFGTGPVDFPDIAANLCEIILSGKAQRGILVCGTGVGASIAANKISRIRAGLCHDVYSARQSVEHDDANVLCIGAWIVGEKVAAEIMKAFIEATFAATEDFKRRLEKVERLESRRGS